MTGQMRTSLAVATIVVLRLAAPAAAEPIHVDAVLTYGGVDPGDASALVAEAARRSGLEAVFAREPACAEASPCLADAARRSGARRGARVTIADVAGEVVASVLIVDGRGRSQRHELSAPTLAGLASGLADALAEPAAAGRPRRTVWILAGLAGGLALSGGAAMWHAGQLRDDFFAEHVDANGDVVGISRDEARRAEGRARTWSVASIALLTVAGASGLAATVLVVRGTDGETRPAGVALAGRF